MLSQAKSSKYLKAEYARALVHRLEEGFSSYFVDLWAFATEYNNPRG